MKLLGATSAAFAFASSLALAEEPKAPNAYLDCKMNYTGLVVEDSGLVDYDAPITFATFDITDCSRESDNYMLQIDRLALAETLLLHSRLSNVNEILIAEEIQFSGIHKFSPEQAAESLKDMKDFLYPEAELQKAFNDISVTACTGVEYQYIRDWQYGYSGHIAIDQESLSPNQLCPTFF